jgi:hypothetical protein
MEGKKEERRDEAVRKRRRGESWTGRKSCKGVREIQFQSFSPERLRKTLIHIWEIWNLYSK